MEPKKADSLKPPIIELGKKSGYEVIENYDLGAGPVDIAWIFKPGKPEIASLPDLRIGFIFILEYSESAINLTLARAILNLIDKLIIVVPTESLTKKISDSIHEERAVPSLLQLRKYVTVLTPSTLVEKSGIISSKKDNDSLELQA
jgi:hypothetical protein